MSIRVACAGLVALALACNGGLQPTPAAPAISGIVTYRGTVPDSTQAAYVAAYSIGLEPAYISDRLKTFKAAFGRQERVEFRGRHLVIVLSKNPAGFKETAEANRSWNTMPPIIGTCRGGAGLPCRRLQGWPMSSAHP